MNRVTQFGYIAALGVILSLSSFLSGCIHDDLGNCPTIETVYIKVVDNRGNDITSSGEVEKADVYIYDLFGRYNRTVILNGSQIEQQEPLEVKSNETVVVWGNVNQGSTIANVGPNTRLIDSEVNMKMGDDGFALALDNLFYGSKNLLAKSSKREIVISPKVARINITVRGIPVGTDAEDYYFTATTKYDGYNFFGTPQNGEAQVRVRGVFRANNDFVTEKTFNIIHTAQGVNQGKIIRILHRFGWVLAEATKDENGKLIVPQAGETVNILIDLSGSALSVKIEITDWDEIYQWVEN